ncbi:MAG: hypothetical protein PUA95_09600 [Lactimicrobium massiliense]|nr:hypothetical protein [Lactimicrobium massiliense]MDD6230969.1 hypothetical protein [Lactimicrobium massiliense]MDD6457395.1 hypothetical protein [Lactimicrobium massiliense]MDD6559654.1 hypothetical protein [Lactimicrobium massiliense]MDD6675534.1 hypothetical protein [Lactimicrobium massiliense]
MFAQSGVGLGGELHILDFRLTDEEMAQIARLNKGVRYYTRTEEALARFASWKPAYEAA